MTGKVSVRPQKTGREDKKMKILCTSTGLVWYKRPEKGIWESGRADLKKFCSIYQRVVPRENWSISEKREKFPGVCYIRRRKKRSEFPNIRKNCAVL